MRYQPLIVERLRLGLAGINQDYAQGFVESCSAPAKNLKEFSDRVNNHFIGLLKETGQSVNRRDFDVPENNDAIPYWIEDLENRVHPQLRTKEKGHGTEPATP